MKKKLEITQLIHFIDTELLCSIKHEIPEPLTFENIHQFNNMKPYAVDLNDITTDEWLEVFKSGFGSYWDDTENNYKVVKNSRNLITIYCGKDSKTKLCQFTNEWDIDEPMNQFKCNYYFNPLRAYETLAKFHADVFYWIGDDLAYSESEILINKNK